MDNILYIETGTVNCQCPKSSKRRQIYFQGFEKDRNSLKYRCRAAASDFECKGQRECHEQSGSRALNYGRTVRIKLEDHNRRIFTPTPHGTGRWRKDYNRRGAAEQIFSRVDQVYCFGRHYIRGLKAMKARASLAVAVMITMALTQVRAGCKNAKSCCAPLKPSSQQQPNQPRCRAKSSPHSMPIPLQVFP